jgi:hypothetical protein
MLHTIESTKNKSTGTRTSGSAFWRSEVVAAFLRPLQTSFSAKRFGETLLKNQRVCKAHADSGGHKLQRSSNKHGSYLLPVCTQFWGLRLETIFGYMLVPTIFSCSACKIKFLELSYHLYCNWYKLHDISYNCHSCCNLCYNNF